MHADEFFVRHDLSHYAIEKALQYTSAFMGMLNKGMDINDFEDREKRKQMNVTREAIHAEQLAILFLMETEQENFDAFNEIYSQSFTNNETPSSLPSLHAIQLLEIRNSLLLLLKSWQELPADETMTLNFDC